MRKVDAPLAREILDLLLDSAKAESMREIYERIEPDRSGRIRTVQNPAGTETGRMSHSDTFLYHPGSTNLANLPKLQALLDPLYNVRECIGPHPGRVMWKADYSQAEARWAAYAACDEERIRLFEENIDPYKHFVALLKWNDPERWPEVKKKERDSYGKVGVLSGQYKVSARTLKNSVNKLTWLHGMTCDTPTAERMEQIWPEQFPKTVEWWEDISRALDVHGYLINSFGRRRDFYGRMDSDSGRAAVVREMIAYGPQSNNADRLGMAMIRLYDEYDPESLRLLLSVHDEVVGDCLPEDLERVAGIVTNVMEQPVELNGYSVVIPAEFNVCPENWAKGEEFTGPLEPALSARG